MIDDTLKFGYRGGLPEGTRAAWGARLIFPDDVVWDRTDCAGDQEAKDELLAWLNDAVGRKPWDCARDLAQVGQLKSNGDTEVVLYSDNRGVVLGNPQRSHGYLYVVAFMRDHMPDEIAANTMADYMAADVVTKALRRGESRMP